MLNHDPNSANRVATKPNAGISVRRFKRRSLRNGGRAETMVSAMPTAISQEIQSQWLSMTRWQRFKARVHKFVNHPDVQLVGTMILGGLMVAVFIAAMLAVVILI